MSLRHPPRLWCGLLLLGCFVLVVGCGPDYKARGTVKGKITYKDKNLTTGSVIFYGATHNMTGSASIDKNGNYTMTDAPLGDVRISVTVPQAPLGGVVATGPFAKEKDKTTKSVDPGGSGRSISIVGDMPTTIVEIPEKFSKPETSGLTFKVSRGEQKHDIPLPP